MGPALCRCRRRTCAGRRRHWLVLARLASLVRRGEPVAASAGRNHTVLLVRVDSKSWVGSERAGNHSIALAGTRGQHAVVANDVRPWWRNQGRKLGDEVGGLENDVSRSITPAVLELVDEAAVGGPGKALQRQRRACDVADDPVTNLTRPDRT
jgi:hypothetical protein